MAKLSGGAPSKAVKRIKPNTKLKKTLDQIEFMMTVDKRGARAVYEAACGRSPEDRGIEEDLRVLYRSQRGAEDIVVPRELILGLLLRYPGKGTGRRRPPKEPGRKTWERRAISWASKLWASNVKQFEASTGKKARQTVSKRMKHEAAESVHANVFGHFLSVKSILRGMSLKKGRKLLQKKSH